MRILEKPEVLALAARRRWLVTAVALLLAGGASTAQAQALVVDNSPDTQGAVHVGPTWINCLGAGCSTDQNWGDAFTLASPMTLLSGGAIFSHRAWGAVGDPVRLVIFPDEGGLPGTEPVLDVSTTLDMVDTTLTTIDSDLRRKHATITPTPLPAGDYWFTLFGIGVEITANVAPFNDGLSALGQDGDPDLERGLIGLGDLFFTLEADDYFAKTIVDGPDEDGDEVIDVVVPVKPGAALAYEFMITYYDVDNPDALIVDNIPAEWVALALDDDEINDQGGPGIDQCGEYWSGFVTYGTVDIYKNGKGKKCHSSTALEWLPDENGATLTVGVATGPSPGKGHKEPAFAPTSCGPLYLNDGATAYETDEFGELVLDAEGYPIMVAGPTDGLCLVAVDQDLLDLLSEYDADADHDGDGLSSYEEACGGFETPPCDPDADDDGVLDGADACPFAGDAGLGVDSVGCPIVQCVFTDEAKVSSTSTDSLWTAQWTLLLAGDGEVLASSEADGTPWGDDLAVSGTFDPNGAISLRYEVMGSE